MTIRAIDLGATLYMPALREDIAETVAGTTLPGLRSIVVCLEDSVREDQVPEAMHRLGRTLSRIRMNPQRRVHTFIRPRDPDMLARIGHMAGVEAVDGYVLPKVTPTTFPLWMDAMRHDHHLIMPTLETAETFDQVEMRRLRDQMAAIADRVLAIRIGGNDLLSLLGARRSRTRTIYDGPLGPVMSMLAGTFVPYGYDMSSPVLEVYDAHDLLAEEVERDVEHGFLTKTAIHPKQIPVIHAGYRVSERELDDARAILQESAAAVFGSAGAMCEPTTHSSWARNILSRAEVHGVIVSDEGLREVA